MAKGKIEERGAKRRNVKPIVLIVTEGSQTEPKYFEHFASSKIMLILGACSKNMKTADVYELINDRTKTAVENAKRAEQHHLQASCMLPFGVDVNPFTDVYKLLERLL